MTAANLLITESRS